GRIFMATESAATADLAFATDRFAIPRTFRPTAARPSRRVIRVISPHTFQHAPAIRQENAPRLSTFARRRLARAERLWQAHAAFARRTAEAQAAIDRRDIVLV